MPQNFLNHRITFMNNDFGLISHMLTMFWRKTNSVYSEEKLQAKLQCSMVNAVEDEIKALRERDKNCDRRKPDTENDRSQSLIELKRQKPENRPLHSRHCETINFTPPVE